MSVNLLTRKTVRDLRRSRAQTVALVAVVALGVATFVAAVGAYRDLAASEATTFERLRFADAWFGLEPVSAAVVNDVAATGGVDAATGRLIIDTGLPVAGGDRVRARLIGIPPGPQDVNDLLILEGARPSQAGEVLLERHFADARGISLGDTLSPLIDGQPLELRVAGIVASAEYIQVTPDRYELLPSPRGFAVIFVDLTELQQATGNPDTVNDLAVRLDPDADASVIDTIEGALRSQSMLREVLRRQDQASFAALEQDLSAFRAIATAMPALILLAGAASVAVMLGRIVRSQRPLIGVMKAIGYTDRAVLRHYLTYAFAVGLLGSTLGVVAGTVLGRAITRGYANELGVPFTTPHFHPGVAVAAVLVTLAAVTAAAARPAWRSARIPPAEAVRIDVSAAASGVARRGRLERLLPLPLWLRLPLRTVARAPGRALGTGFGIGAAFVLVLMVLGLRDGIDLFLQRVFDDVEQWDASATFDQPQTESIATDVGAWPGVTEISPYLQLPASLTTGAGREDVLLTALEPGQDLHVLRLNPSVEPESALGAGQIVLTDSLAADLNVGRGDPLTIVTPAGEADLRVGGITDEPIPARAYVSLDEAARLAGTPSAPINGLYLRLDPDAGSEIRARLYDLPGAEAVKLRQEMRDELQSLLAVFNLIIATMLTFAVAMAFALVFNAMTINVLEREREYGTMRAIGARPGLIGRYLASEATALWALAAVPGFLAGTWVAVRLGDAVAADLFALPVHITTTSYLSTGIGVLAVVILALILPLRRVRRLDLASATKTLG